MLIRTLFIFVFLVCFHPLAAQDAQLDPSEKLREGLTTRVIQNEVFQEGFFGFRLVEAESGEALFDYRGDNYFTPASNVKLLTWFLVETLLADSMTAFYHQTVRDTFYLRGSGYPLLLHPDFDSVDVASAFLSRIDQPIVMVDQAALERYGSGWSWDDYNYGYVYERSWLPVYGNRLSIRRQNSYADLEVIPGLLSPNISLQSDEAATGLLTKKEGENSFFLAERLLKINRGFNVQRPLNISTLLTAQLLSSGLGINVSASKQTPDSLPWTAYRVPRPDTLLRQMLLTSDNFLAEQLLLSSLAEWDFNRSLSEFRAYVSDSLLPELAFTPRQWVDGSGLSRYNQFSPRQFTQLLRRIYALIGPEAMKTQLPTGGVNGTLQNYFTDHPSPYLWAKTGSLRNVLALSGLIETSSGKLLIFSFLHNNFPGKSRAHYVEMEKIMAYIRDNY